MIPPLAIIQARMGSTRFPGKMMAPLAGHPLIWYAWRRSIEAFGEANVVVAIPASNENHVLRDFIVESCGGRVFEWAGPEDDVLGRFFHCAHAYRWHPHSVILRVTPDDPLKDPVLMQAVAAGERHPVELSCEAFTLDQVSMLEQLAKDPAQREHLSTLFPVSAPSAPPGTWSVDTEADLLAIEERMRGG